VLPFGPLYHLTGAADRRQALPEAGRVLRPGGRLLAMAVWRFASLLDGLYRGWLGDPVFRPIVDQDLADGQTAARPCGQARVLHHGLLPHTRRPGRRDRGAAFTSVTVYGVEGPGWPLREDWADAQRREHILFAARAAETQPSLAGFSPHLIAAATKP
jgi:hypothetical protein